MKGMQSLLDGSRVGSSADRELLIAYLEYAVSDVAALDANSALLLQLAIAHLKQVGRDQELAPYGRHLC